MLVSIDLLKISYMTIHVSSAVSFTYTEQIVHYYTTHVDSLEPTFTVSKAEQLLCTSKEHLDSVAQPLTTEHAVPTPTQLNLQFAIGMYKCNCCHIRVGLPHCQFLGQAQASLRLAWASPKL